MDITRRVVATGLVVVAAAFYSADLQAGKKVRPGDAYRARASCSS